MHSLHCQAQRIKNMTEVAYHLEQKREEALQLRKEEESENSDQLRTHINIDAFTNHQLLNTKSAANAFIKMTKMCSLEIHAAARFESDLVSHVNPNHKRVDKMFAWGIIPYCETSNEGMKKVFYKMGENFRMFTLDEDERRCKKLQNIKN